MNSVGLLAAAAPIIVIVGLCAWVMIRASRTSRRRVGSYAVMYALFFSFGSFFQGGPQTIQVAKDPEWKKRPENGDPPEKCG